jgi:hypothetical protein
LKENGMSSVREETFFFNINDPAAKKSEQFAIREAPDEKLAQGIGLMEQQAAMLNQTRAQLDLQIANAWANIAVLKYEVDRRARSISIVSSLDGFGPMGRRN